MSAGDYQRLRQAVLAYDAVLKHYGILGESWTGAAPQLDQLYAAMLEAARPGDPPEASDDEQ